jgi:N-carbamoyl-L-amino-acid hydrolase
MIFVPSRDGISHAPTEYTSPDEITNVANVLLKTLIGMDSTL